MTDQQIAEKMYGVFVARNGGVAGGDRPNWASLPIGEREIWIELAAMARRDLKLDEVREAKDEALDNWEGWVEQELDGTKSYAPLKARIATLREV